MLALGSACPFWPRPVSDTGRVWFGQARESFAMRISTLPDRTRVS